MAFLIWYDLGMIADMTNNATAIQSTFIIIIKHLLIGIPLYLCY